MKIYAYKSNRQFCCDIRTIKNIFNKTNIKIDFGFLTTKYGTSIQDKNYYFCKKNIKGKVVASIQMIDGYKTTILSLYAITKKDLKNYDLTKIQEDFKNNILPKIYDFYMEHLEYKDNNFEYILLVDLVEDKLFIRSGRF